MTIATVDNMENVYANLASTLQQQGIDALLPVHVTPEQFTRTAANALVENSDLQFADKSSLVLALTRCARDGLLPDGREAALVVRKQKVSYMPMVDGVLKRARQSGQVANIVSKVVYDADEFKYWVDERGEHIKHVPRFEERGEIRLVYAFAKLTSGELVVEVMGRAEVDKVRATVTSSGKEGSPWVKWYDRMALKTVLHRLARRLPCAAEMFSLLEAGYDVPDAEKPRSEAHRTSGNARPRLRDVLNQPRFTPETEVKSTVVQETTPEAPDNPAQEPESAPLELEVLLIALDDVTDEQSYRAVAEQCKTLAKTLSDAHRGVLREKMKQSMVRVRKSPGDDDIHAKTQTPVALAEGHAEPAGHSVTVVPFANTTQNAWRFPDGTVISQLLAADRKAKGLGMVLEEKRRGRFSQSH
jgi:recombination protein RecT